MFTLIKALYRAWQTGEIIRNPAKWKSGAELTSGVTAFVAAVFTVLLYFFPQIEVYLTTEMAALVGTIIITVLGIIQIVIGRVSTRLEVGPQTLLKDNDPKGATNGIKTPQKRVDDK